jgi:hypothetical protein
VPYATCEIPVPGDYVKNQLEQPGPVRGVRMASNGDDFVSIRSQTQKLVPVGSDVEALNVLGSVKVKVHLDSASKVSRSE